MLPPPVRWIRWRIPPAAASSTSHSARSGVR